MQPNNMKLTDKQKQALVDLGLWDVAQKNTPSSTTPNAQTMHGINAGGYDGLFSSVGVRPDMYSALPRVRSLSRILPFYKSRFENERVEILTGQLATTGTNATNWCGDGPVAGDLKKCQQYYPFGNFLMRTKLNQLPTMGGLVDRADLPRQLRNNAAVDNPFVPDVMIAFPNDSARQLQVELYKLGVAFERAIERVCITGNRSNSGSNAQLGVWQEWDGLDLFIKTGYIDAVTSVACPAADSMVINFNSTDIAGTLSGGDGRDIMDVITDLVYAGQDYARRLNVSVDYAFLMRSELFRALTDIWACQYSTSRCEVVSANDRRVLDAIASNQLRIDMLTGYYLLVDGIMYPVIISDGIPQGGGSVANTFVQDLYLLPLRVSGVDTLYMEYFDMDNPYINEFAGFIDGAVNYRTLNNGLYGVALKDTGFCKEYHFAARIRLMLEAPFLAGRVDDISFKFRAPVRSPYPNESFYADGGVTFVDR